MYGIFTCIYNKNQPHVGKYTSPMDPMGKSRCFNAKTTLDWSAIEAIHWKYKPLRVQLGVEEAVICPSCQNTQVHSGHQEG